MIKKMLFLTMVMILFINQAYASSCEDNIKNFLSRIRSQDQLVGCSEKVFALNRNNTYGISKYNGNINSSLIKNMIFDYDEIIAVDEYLNYNFLNHETLFVTKKNNKYGVYNLIPNEYDSITPVKRGFIMEKNGKFGVYHITKGNILKLEYDKIGMQSDWLLTGEINGQTIKTVDMTTKSALEGIHDKFIGIMFFPIFYPLEHGIP